MPGRAATRVVQDFGAWLAERDREESPDAISCLKLLLEARETWLKCFDPASWKSGDVHRLLIDTAAPRLSDVNGLTEHGATVLRALFDFLEETDRFHPAGMRPAALRKELERAAAKFPAAMADESERLPTPVPAEPRREDPPEQLPPISLPPTAELAERARESVLLHHMVACGQWAADGRDVTKQGFPSPEDTRSFGEALGIDVRERLRDLRDQIPLIRIWRLALDTEALQLHRTKVVAGPGLAELEQALLPDADPGETLRVWAELAAIAVSGPAPADSRDARAYELAEFCRPWGTRALRELSRAEEEFDLGEVAGKLIDLHHKPGIPGLLASLTGAAIRNGLLAGVEAGAVAVTVPDGVAPQAGALLGEPIWAVTPVPGTRVRLTPLGRYFVREAQPT